MAHPLLPVFAIALTSILSHAESRWDFDAPDKLAIAESRKNPARFVDGVSGKALVFDGYHTEIAIPSENSPVLGERFSISAWVAPQEYSWNLSAIINRQQDFAKGWFFGLNQTGQMVAAVATESGWMTCLSKKSIPLLKWSRVVMTCDAAKGLGLYIDGEKVGETTFAGKLVFAPEAETIIGRTQVKMTPALTERKTSQAVRSWMRYDGLLDELVVRDSVPPDAEIHADFKNTKVARAQPLKYRRMPSGTDAPRPFGAYPSRLEYAPGWDANWQGSDLPDIVVRFDDSPVKVVFWRGTGYIPAFVSEKGIWMTDQSGENWGTGECFEVMGDKQCRYSHVRILENTPARVVIHWRYALASIAHKIYVESDTYPGDWMDEYWTIYPDGVGVRKQVLWSKFEKSGSYQFQETIFFNQPGTKPQDNVEMQALTFMDMSGRKSSYAWDQGAPKSFPEPHFKPIEMVNFKSQYRPFTIHHPERLVRPFNFGWVKGYSTFPCWNHWPVSQIPSDGRNAQAPDKPSHSSLTAAEPPLQQTERFSDGSVRVRILMGMTKEPIESLLPLARSWNFPPKLATQSAAYHHSGYDPYQRAYLFEKKDAAAKELVCEIPASPQSPIVNLCFVIKKWGPAAAIIQLNGEPVSCKTGVIRALEGDDLVVWIPVKSTESVKVSVK